MPIYRELQELRGEKIDIVTVSDNGLVQKVAPKPGRNHSGWTWVAATWNPEFSYFLHTRVQKGSDIMKRELYVADVISAAIAVGLCVCSHYFPDGKSFDLGTPDELEKFWNSAYT